MSYILEALKKAQAERQLGNAPTIHAPQPVQAAEPGVAASRKPLFIGLGAGALVVGLGALLVWHRAHAPAPAVVSASAPVSPAGAAPALAAPAAAPAAPARVAERAAASDTLEVSAPPAPPPPARPAHVAEAPARPAPSAAGRAGAGTPASSAPPAAPAPAVAAPHAAAAPSPAPSPAPASAPAPEDSLPYLHQLPDAVQRDVPRVSFGGYMYSASPADRLLLVDKALRHEGEEVAPGLVLEKLLPKAAVMNYRGVRYRVAY
jgi:general secretion pathway protein B